MKKIYEKPTISEVAFKDPILNIRALSVHNKNGGGNVIISRFGEDEEMYGNMYEDARSRDNDRFWDDDDFD